MELKATIGFVHPSRFDKIGVLECDVMLLADETFGNNDYKNQVHALKLMDTELKAAVQRVNDRLKSEGLTKENFIYCKPKQAPRYDEYGNLDNLTTDYSRHWICRRTDHQQEQSQNHNTKLMQKDETSS